HSPLTLPRHPKHLRGESFSLLRPLSFLHRLLCLHFCVCFYSSFNNGGNSSEEVCNNKLPISCNGHDVCPVKDLIKIVIRSKCKRKFRFHAVVIFGQQVNRFAAISHVF